MGSFCALLGEVMELGVECGSEETWTDLRTVLKGKPTSFSDGSDLCLRERLMKYNSKVIMFTNIGKISVKMSLTS